MRRVLVLAGFLTVALAITATAQPTRPAEASFHFAEISEVMAGYNGDSQAQYIEINMRSGGQNFVAGTKLVLFTGTEFGNVPIATYTVPSDVANSGDGTRWIMGTRAFETASGMQVDFEITPIFTASFAEMVCWGAFVNAENANEHVDCLSYNGNCCPTVPSPPPTPLPPGNGCDLSLTRVVPATFDPFTPPSDTWADGSNAADFQLLPASPQNNAGGTPALFLTDTDGDTTVDCQDADDDADGLNDVADNCLLVANAGQEDGDADALGDACDPFPTNVNGDGDACSDGEEAGDNPGFGGRRDPANFYDFYDVTGDQSVDLADSLKILQHFGHAPNGDPEDDNLDRDIPDTDYFWRSAASDTGVDLTDVLAQLRQFGHDCTAPPN